jgi:signal recognition particle GTPase
VNTDFQTKKGKKNNFQATVDWQGFSQEFTEENRKDLLENLATYLLQVPVNQQVKSGFIEKAQNETQQEAIKKMVTGLMMLPEYQLS